MLYEALLVQHKYGTHKVYLANEYVQYKAMQDIREIEFRDSESNTNTKIYFEIRATALRPRLHTEGFPLRPHMTSHKGNLYRGICNYKRGVYNSTLQHNHLYSRGKVRIQNSITSTQEGWAQRQLQSPLHKRDKALSQNTITSAQEG